MNEDTWIQILVRECMKRDALELVLTRQSPSPEEISLDYSTVSVQQRLDILHQLCEWSLDNVDRFRNSIRTTTDDSLYWVCFVTRAIWLIR